MADQDEPQMGVPADPMNMQAMQQTLHHLQTELQQLRQAAVQVEANVNAQVDHAVQAAVQQVQPAALGRARATPPEPWYGEPDDIPLNEWMVQLQTYFEVTNTRDQQQHVLVAAGNLRGAAGTWWRSRFEASVAGDRELPGDLWQLIEDLRVQFGRVHENRDVRREWARLRQGSRSVTAYTHHFRRLMLQIEDSNPGEKLFRYLEGLNDRLRTKVEVEAPRDLDHAIALAATWEGPADAARRDRNQDGYRSDSRSRNRRRDGYQGRSRSRGRGRERGRSSSRGRSEERSYYHHAPAPHRNYAGDRMEIDNVQRNRVHFDARTPSRERRRSSTPNPRRPAIRSAARASQMGDGVERRRCFRCGRQGHLKVNCRAN